MIDDIDLATLVNDLRHAGSPDHKVAIDRVCYRGGETRISGKGLGTPDPNAECRAAVARKIAQDRRREDLPVLQMLLREEATCCRKAWGGSQLLKEIGKAISAFAEPSSVPVLVWAMNQSFDCYSMLDAEVFKPFYTPKTLAFLQQLGQDRDETKRKLAAASLKYLKETFGSA